MDHESGVGARRLAVMLRHSTHLLFGLLWAVAMLESARATTPRAAATALGAAEGVLYLAGLLAARRRATQVARPGEMPARRSARHQRVGRSWVTALVLVWMLLCCLAAPWLWLAFPLYFLVFFIVPAPARWAVVAVVALWSAASAAVRGDSWSVGQVVGPLVGALVAVIAWVVLEQLRANVREQQRLVDQVRATQQQLLAATEQRARDQERERLSRDLHDTLAQGLNSIVMLSRTSAARHPELGEELAVIETTARDNLAHARSMLHDMATTIGNDEAGPPAGSPGRDDMPDASSAADATSVHSAGPVGRLLTDEVREVVDASRAREQVIGSGLQLGFSEQGTPRAVDAGVRHALVMGVRSLLANVVQHAQATRCQVSLTWQGDHVALDVVDDGIGFDPVSATGYGLAALRTRMREVGATMELASGAGQGCSVAITAPLTSAGSGHRPQGVSREH